MTKLTAGEIENFITQSHANITAVQEVTHEHRVIDRVVTRELRACFTAGVDHGQALVLERADALLAAPVADSEHAQVGRAFGIISDWAEALKGRAFIGCTACGAGDMAWHASVLLAEPERKPGVIFVPYVFASTRAEALAKMATWCTEHTAGFRFDTEPAPPMVEVPVTAGSYGNLLGESFLKTVVGEFIADDAAPTTERNS